ncbi:hypothetical protein OV450_8156 [Actinobacteria bacterium OV450]|nr:hypothetical protein OV450_8156 [Actinobacteria bacterium OV450]
MATKTLVDRGLTRSRRCSVTPAASRADLRAFHTLPHRLYCTDQPWIAPLLWEQHRLWSARHNPFIARTEAVLLLARDGDGVPVGRVAALLNPDRGPSQFDGFLGAFECLDDAEIATALIEAGCAWLRERGARTVVGPMNPNMHNECGLLLDGYDDPPLIGMPYTAPYYPTLFESAGLLPVKDLLSFRFDTRGSSVQRLKEFVERHQERYDIVVRDVDRRRFKDEITLVCDLYTRAWHNNWGFAAMTRDEAASMARQLRHLAPRGVRIAEHHGTPVGFIIMLPDFNQALGPARGRLTHYGLPLGAWRVWRARRHINRGRVMATGIVPDAVLGLGSVLIADAIKRAAENGWGEVDVSWVLEDNTAAVRPLISGGAAIYKRHRLYARCLTHLNSCTCTDLTTSQPPAPETPAADG